MARETFTVEMKGIYSFKVPATFGYGYETKYIYNMEGEDGTVYVWKTGKFWGIPVYEGVNPDTAFDIDDKGRAYNFQRIVKGDRLVITATVKGKSEYKGQPQTELQRCKVVELLSHTKSWEDIQAEKEAEKKRRKQEQLDSIKDGDFIWNMPYSQYKEHYSDCETIIDSYEAPERAYGYRPAMIKVIIREGRLKASGVRGKRFYGWELRFTHDGVTTSEVFKAVCYENAVKQLKKQCRDAQDIELENVY